MLTRRKFIGECSLLAAAACLPSAVVVAHPAFASIKPGSIPGFADFVTQINTRFTVRTPSVTAPFLLVAVTPLTAPRTDPDVTGNEAFCLRFQGPAQFRLPQNTYLLTHPYFGALEIFLVPVGRPDAASNHYEAVFDRPANPDRLARQIAQAPRREQIT